MNIWIATENENKKREFSELFAPLGITVKTVSDIKDFQLPPETGKTFAENATIKAEAVFSKVGEPVIADDSGLTVDALDGAPGIYSARFAGEDASDADRRKLILELLKESTDKTAYFVCDIALIDKKGNITIYEGNVPGEIVNERGNNGFGYDSIFQPVGQLKTLAELTSEMKNKISHRSIALSKLMKDNPIKEMFVVEEKEGK